MVKNDNDIDKLKKQIKKQKFLLTIQSKQINKIENILRCYSEHDPKLKEIMNLVNTHVTIS